MAAAGAAVTGAQAAPLYAQCLARLARGPHAPQARDMLPHTVLLDLYYQMVVDNRLCVLAWELSNLDVFSRLLKFAGAQRRLVMCVQAVIEHGSKLTSDLAQEYLRRCDQFAERDQPPQRDALVHLGLRLGGFLNETGWYADAEKTLLACRDLCHAAPQSTHYKRLTLECCHRLLRTQSEYCCFPGAAETYSLALSLLGIEEEGAAARDQRPEDGDRRCKVAKLLDDKEAEAPDRERRVQDLQHLLPILYKEFSLLFFVRCEYNAAYKWSTEALKLLTPDTPAKITVEVLRACGKACVQKRRFSRAGLLMRQAVALARRAFGARHPRYAFALLDYGFYLLNIDNIQHSVNVYEDAYKSLREVFGARSLHTAAAQEDLAYALYVLEYASGRFYKAKEHAERAIQILESLVPSDHLMLASVKRVKALILEEIALDMQALQDYSEPNLLEESEALHKAALELSTMAFGEKNVQTAKHYGNLGRLYQSMQKFQDAESMHLKAIKIKEELLGAEDYEVGLSIGHLASLYNYHMNMHCAAEQLYFRSISISLKLFGECYSGLEYDYRGLIHVFTILKQPDRAQFYHQLLYHWHSLREQSQAEKQPMLGQEEAIPLEELKQQFFNPNID